MSVFGATDADENSAFHRGQDLFRRGNFADAIQLADSAIQDPLSLDEGWLLLKARSELAIGKYADAKRTIDLGLEENPTSIRLRWLGQTVYVFHNDVPRSTELKNEIGSLLKRGSWRYRGVPDRLITGHYRLDQGADAKSVLDEVYTKARDQGPTVPDVYLAIGDLALEKHDYELAATNYSQAIELNDALPESYAGLAHAYRASLPEKATAAIVKALAINSNHMESLLFVVEQQLAAENYAAAEATIQKILKVNPHRPEAWAFRAVLAHLENDRVAEDEYRGRALGHWTRNPQVDYLIGRELSKKYRFQEGSEYQRRALGCDANFGPAKIQLAHDLLRLGQELEGWKLAGDVFDADQYNVVANNLVALRENLSQFAAIEKNGFVIRMDRREAAAYGHLVLEVLDEASQQLSAKYRVKLRKPIFIEIFPRQQDFAIRTFGLPGGSGFLGVCFGRVVTMNSPAAQGAVQTNWRSVLWHELCHVVTLQKTNNKLPRWLSEGISVYEERLANDAWGDSIRPRHRQMILGDQLTPVSQLSSAFLNPKSPDHLQFAYYESSLVVRFLVERFGEQALVDLLEGLGEGLPINDALRRHMAPTEFLDEQFEVYARRVANGLAPRADWFQPTIRIARPADWASWLEDHPNSYAGLLGRSQSLIAEEDYQGAVAMLDRFHQIYPDGRGAEEAYRMRAVAMRQLGNPVAEIESLEKVIRWDADDVPAGARLLEIYAADNNWDDVKRVSRRLQGIQPMSKSSHRYMALAAEKSADDSLLVQELKVLLSLNPIDRAETHFRLGAAQFRQGRWEAAKRDTLFALEAAPRFRDAHRLLLDILTAMDQQPEQAASADSDGSLTPASAR